MVKLDVKGGAGTINFDVKARLEEKERRSQTVVVGLSAYIYSYVLALDNFEHPPPPIDLLLFRREEVPAEAKRED